jgi:EH domain-containing protein 1
VYHYYLTLIFFREITIIDTPGVLSGEKQRLSRGYSNSSFFDYCPFRYDFAQVSKWFAERSDLILLLFDSYKLDISDEFRGIIENLKTCDDKVIDHFNFWVYFFLRSIV